MRETQVLVFESLEEIRFGHLCCILIQPKLLQEIYKECKENKLQRRKAICV
jgi:hypothetical protein